MNSADRNFQLKLLVSLSSISDFDCYIYMIYSDHWLRLADLSSQRISLPIATARERSGSRTGLTNLRCCDMLFQNKCESFHALDERALHASTPPAPLRLLSMVMVLMRRSHRPTYQYATLVLFLFSRPTSTSVHGAQLIVDGFPTTSDMS